MRGAIALLAASAALAAPASALAVERFPLTGLHDPNELVRGPDRMTPRGRVLREYPTGDWPVAIVRGPDRALWFTTGAAEDANTTQSGLGRVTPRGVRRFYVRATCIVSPFGLTLGPDRALWFTQLHGPAGLGRFAP